MDAVIVDGGSIGSQFISAGRARGGVDYCRHTNPPPPTASPTPPATTEQTPHNYCFYDFVGRRRGVLCRMPQRVLS